MFLKFGGVSDLGSRAEEGSGEESARASSFDFLATDFMPVENWRAVDFRAKIPSNKAHFQASIDKTARIC